MGLGAQLILDSIQRGQASDRALAIANQTYGEGSKEAMFAQNAPDQFMQIYAKQFDPAVQLAQQKQKAALALAGGDAGGSNPILQATQGMPQDADAMMGGGQQVSQSPGGLTAQERMLLAISDPDKLNQYILDQSDPKKRAEATEAVQKANVQPKGQQQFASIIDEVSGLYDQLHQKGADISTDPGRDALKNYANSIAGDDKGSFWGLLPAGQDINRRRGTPEQAIRDQIAAKVPLISAAIKSATGMSSQQLNSNFELQQYMKALSSPGSAYESNKSILESLKNLYGGPQAQAAVAQPQQAANPILQATQQRRVVKFGDLK